MKIGLIGNMNNNNFALMRYFRDLGADAHLLLYSTDGHGSLSHFTPEADTWELEKWQPFIHQTVIPNAPIAALGPPVSWLMAAWSQLKAAYGLQVTPIFSVSQQTLRRTYGQYDTLIASGITPSTLQRINRGLDIFYPYSCEVEFLYSSEFTSRFTRCRGFSRRIFELIQQTQALGIQRSRHVLNYDPGITEDALNRIGVFAKRLSIPMVYSSELFPDSPPTDTLKFAVSLAEDAPLSFLHSARLMYVPQNAYTHQEWVAQNKHNDWFFHAFAWLIRLRPGFKVRLFVLEYGPDVDATKKLVAQLDIEHCVTWLPKMKRKELLWLLRRVTVGVGEFLDVPNMIWGGTGWEALANSKPLIQGFNFSEGEFESLYGYPPPPLLPVRNSDDILRHLLDFVDKRLDAQVIGRSCLQWFETYNGIGTARKWLDLVTQPKQLST